ncbi:MAG: LysR family transcriptional regulator [Solirubrobacterales bacterium]|nr:LysR family transcriptional regulator [Solirubrobacterales bacterium]
MELRQLRYFLAVAEDLHFTHAAQRMHVAQPALSAQVRGLEREVGGPLLDRSTRNVRLTEAGEALARAARVIVNEVDRALAEARSVARRDALRLSVGCLGAPGDVLSEALDAFSQQVVEAEVDFQTFDFVEIWQALTTGDIDLAFAYLPSELTDFEQLTGVGALDVVRVADEPRVVVLSASHELARRDGLSPSELASETFISHPDEVPECWRDFWLLTKQLNTRPAVYEARARNVDQWLYLIERGHGIDTCPAYVARYYSWPTLSYVPLLDAPPSTLSVLSRKHDRPPLAEALLNVVGEVASAT